MPYVVIREFTDLEDDNHIYRPWDEYPRAGKRVKKARIEELSGSENKRGEPLIELVSDEEMQDL